MNWRFAKSLINLLVLGYFLGGCEQSEYTKLVKSELAKGIRRDSVLLGIKLGDSQEQFRERCFALNKEHLTTEGTGFYVQYFITDSLAAGKSGTIRLLFKPEFDENNAMTDMEMKFSYLGWAPWNRQFFSDSLKVRVIKMFEQGYGGNKFVVAHFKDKEIPVKVDGNRRILLFEDAPQTVVVKVQDMLHPKYKETIK